MLSFSILFCLVDTLKFTFFVLLSTCPHLFFKQLVLVIEFDFFFVPPAEIARLEHLRVPMLPVFDLHVSQGRNTKLKLFQNDNQRKRQQQMQQMQMAQYWYGAGYGRCVW